MLLAACASSVPALAEHDPYPDDGTLTAAVPIEIDRPIADRIGPSGEDVTDWKSFAVKTPSRLRIRFVAAGNVKLMVYADDGATIASLAGRGGEEQVFVAILKPGHYLMELTAPAAASPIDYVLTLEATPTAPGRR
jgi:hypothetical protein